MASSRKTYRAGQKTGVDIQAALLLAGLFFLLVFAGAGSAGAAPADQGVSIKADVGWQGRGVPGRTAPAVVDLYNPGSADLEGVVEVVTYHKQTFPPPPGSP
ncbi:MAG: hypothetical protein H5T99_05630, partial [Moorella sp. (in: Bacteria)]|nr:hypothetical protein [Moorella sp. (in: firmicutes)]